MIMLQYSICDMHFGIMEFNGFLTKLFIKIINIMCFIDELEDYHANRTTNLLFVPHQLRMVKLCA